MNEVREFDEAICEAARQPLRAFSLIRCSETVADLKVNGHTWTVEVGKRTTREILREFFRVRLQLLAN